MARIRLREDQLRKFRKLRTDLATDDALAKAMGVNPATVSRVLHAKHAPGERFIAGLLLVFGIEWFSDLFEVVENGPAEDAA